MSDAPLISVIIPSYKGGHFLPAALAALRDQRAADGSPMNLEIVIVDDGLGDNTVDIIRDYYGDAAAGLLNRFNLVVTATPSQDSVAEARRAMGDHYDPAKRDIVVVAKPQNGGASRARNDALKVASGVYIAYMDSDDLSHPDRMTKQVADLENAPEGHWLSVVNMRSVYADGRSSVEKRYSDPARYLNDPVFFPDDPQREVWATLNVIIDEAFPLPSGWMMRRETIEALEGFDPSIHYAEDLELILRLYQLEGPSGVRIVPGEPLFDYADPGLDKVYRAQADSAHEILKRHGRWLRQHLTPEVFVRFVEAMTQRWQKGQVRDASLPVPAGPNKGVLTAHPAGVLQPVS